MRSNEECARRILEVVPLVMRNVGAEMRQKAAAGFSVPHFRVLALLRQEARSLSELAQCQAVALPTMSRTVSAMAERGWVTRSEDVHDRRRVVIRLTDEGHAYYESLHACTEEHVARLVEALSSSERETLVAGLELLHRIIDREESP